MALVVHWLKGWKHGRNFILVEVEKDSHSFTISLNNKLDRNEKAVERRFALAIQRNLKDLIEEYGDRFGKVIDIDCARELCPEYAVSNATRARLTRAIYPCARVLADELYRRVIYARPAPPQALQILFTSGGILALSRRCSTCTAPISTESFLIRSPLASCKSRGISTIKKYHWTIWPIGELRESTG
jgi:hypothetical protein